MSAADIARSFLERSQHAQEVDALTQLFQSALYRLGFRYFACSCHVDPLQAHEAVMRLNYPAAWIDTYSQMRLQCIDPVFERARTTSSGFHWNSKAFLRNLSERQKAMLAEAHQFGLGNGYTIPIRSPNSPYLIDASCSVIPDSRSLPDAHYLVLAEMAFAMFERVIAIRHPTPRKPILSRRQRQCMELVMQGKSAGAIGVLLQLSETTIRTHIEAAKVRLDAISSPQAAMTAYLIDEVSVANLQQQLLSGSRITARRK